ncbi:MAG: GAF domain-containing protein, partial [Anaerolineae bacterium]|nr:GAF domain-containing protein [Anaerolineae bacterium]
RAKLRGTTGWLVLLIGLLLAGNLFGLAAEAGGAVNAAREFHAGALIVFAVLTLRYLQRPRLVPMWVAVGLVWLAALLAVRLLSLPISPDLVALAGWIVFGVGLSLLSFYGFYAAHLPEVANRALFWTLVIPLVLLGIILSASGIYLLVEIGWLAGLGGVALALYGLLAERLFDVRRALVRGMGTVVATLITSLVIMAALIFAAALIEAGEFNPVVMAALALVVAALYVPLRQIGELLARRLIAAPADPTPALRHYSQRIAAIIELDEVVQLAMQTLVSVLRVRPGGLLLVTASHEDRVLLEPLADLEATALPLEAGEIDPNGPIYVRLFGECVPLLQFDLEFNQAFAGISPAERAFFTGMKMSAYAPILVDGQTIGLLASGPKYNDEPFQPADLEMLATVANQTGIALRNARLVSDLRQLNLELEATNADMGRLDSVKTDFITVASHELRTPLAQIRGYTDMLEQLNEAGMLDPTQMVGMMRNLRKASERMETLISAMLDVSKIDVDAMDLHFAQTTMESTIRLAIDPLTEAIRTRKLSLSARGLRGLPAVEADLQRLVQAFRNVIGNAIKYTPDGGQIDIRAELEERPGRPGQIHVTVRDTGIGLDAAHHELIFEKFFRVADPKLHSTGDTKFMGAGPGLGLTIARGIIEGHGGHIWVESEGYDPNRLPGTTFHVVVPVQPPADARRVLPFDETKVSASFEEREDLMRMVAAFEAQQAEAGNGSEPVQQTTPAE